MLQAKLLYYRTVYSHLSDSRQYTQSGSPLPVPISEYVAYCELFEIKSLRERERLFKMVRAQDRAYVQYATEKIRAEMDTKSKSAVATQ